MPPSQPTAGRFIESKMVPEICMGVSVVQWHGWIKDYDGGTLMEGRIHSTLAFVRFPQMLRCQRQALDAAIRSLSRCHIVYPGLSHSGPDGQCIHIPIDQIPGTSLCVAGPCLTLSQLEQSFDCPPPPPRPLSSVPPPTGSPLRPGTFCTDTAYIEAPNGEVGIQSCCKSAGSGPAQSDTAGLCRHLLS